MHLRQKSRIGLVSTARKITSHDLEPAISLLSKWGLTPVLSPELFEEDCQFAGTDSQRIAAFQRFIDDPTLDAILCVRGGYGTVRLIDSLDFNSIEKKPKWIIGYSDVTVLHLDIAAKYSFPTLHATMPINFSNNTPAALESLRKVLFGEALTHSINPHPFNSIGSTQGKLIGGNLSIIYSLLGSPSIPQTTGAILFLEDLDEYLYHIDRMMYNLARNGILNSISGLIVGGMSDMNDNTVPFGESAEQIIKRHCKNLNIPIAFGFPAGHLEDNRALIMGREALLTVGETTELSWL